MRKKYPWETAAARRLRALQMCAQCAGEHKVGALIWFCQMRAGHKGPHIDVSGRRFTSFFSYLSTAVQRARSATKKTPAPTAAGVIR